MSFESQGVQGYVQLQERGNVQPVGSYQIGINIGSHEDPKVRKNVSTSGVEKNSNKFTLKKFSPLIFSETKIFKQIHIKIKENNLFSLVLEN